MDATDLVGEFRIVPVVAIDDVERAVPLAEVLLQSGIGIIEITLRTPAALAAIEAVATNVPEMLIGAGSVRHAAQVSDVASAGARFAVSPGSTDALLCAASDSELPFIPGAVTPSEVIALLERGYRLQKFFPAEAAGGIPFLKSIASPVPEASFMPTGGISAELAIAYLALPNVSGVGGSWITPPDLLAAGDFDRIGMLAADAATLGV